MRIAFPDAEKKPGVSYAFTDDGLELPVVDVTHPAFAVPTPSEAELHAMIERGARDQEQNERLPAVLRKALFWLLARNSRLMRGVLAANGTYLSAMSTYLLKLGPGNLAAPGFGRIDRAIAASAPSFSARKRLQDIAGALADGLRPMLEARLAAPVVFVNLAGGPCMDSLNALLLLRRDHPRLIDGRRVRVHVFDLEPAAPAFGARALAALTAPGGALPGLDAQMVHHAYDWLDPERLCRDLSEIHIEAAVVAASSEGGVGDYGSDEIVVSNLGALARALPADAVLAVTITPDKGRAAAFNRTSRACTVPRSLEAFGVLASRAGWTVAQSWEQPMNWVVRLGRTMR